MLNEQAYQHICSKIESGDLRPGDQVSPSVIAKEVGVSFIPVREAIARLVEEGLLDHRFGIGSFVAVPTRQDIRDMYQLREVLEGFAASQVGNGMTQDTTAAMREINDQMRQLAADVSSSGSDEWSSQQVNEWITRDRQFHRELLQSAGNQAVIEAIERVMTRSRMLAWIRRRRPPAALARVCDEHDGIVEAMQRGDGAEARKLVVAHIHQGREFVLQAFDLYSLQWKLPPL